eukprot:5747102-Pleurochrysis_carterae.AAC.3
MEGDRPTERKVQGKLALRHTCSISYLSHCRGALEFASSMYLKPTHRIPQREAQPTHRSKSMRKRYTETLSPDHVLFAISAEKTS